MKYLKLFDLDDDYQVFMEGEDFITPNVSYTLDTKISYFNPKFDYSKEYIHVEALEDGLTVKLNANTISYSIDECKTWNTLMIGTNSPTINAGEKIYFKSELTPASYGIGTFSMTKQCDVKGNVMSLLYGDDFKNKTDLTGKDYAFFHLFAGCSTIVNARDLVLPSTTLSQYCYYGMFRNCVSLTNTPKLPATILTSNCYESMFDGCSSLTSAPELPATTLANNCYYYMFQRCSSLTSAPELPATTLVDYCYCQMFSSCILLNYIKMLATDISANYCLNGWLFNTSSTGTFVKSAGVEIPTGTSGIPSGWEVQTV